MINEQNNKIVSRKSLEKLMFSRLLILSGLLFLVVGIYLFISSSKLEEYIHLFLQNILKHSNEHVNKINKTDSRSIFILFLYFVPAMLLLMIGLIVNERVKVLSKLLTIFISLYFIFIQIKLFINANLGGYEYNNFFTASLFLITTSILLYISSLIFKKLYFSVIFCSYFYLTSMLLILTLDGHITLFVFIIFFSIIITLLEKKIIQPKILLVNYFFAFSFSFLYFFKKLIVNNQTEFFPFFFDRVEHWLGLK